MGKIVFEVCANSVQSAINAEKGGADRIELCTNLYQGGTTPSAAEIEMTIEKLKIPVFVLIRPRPGHFFYSDIEFELMKKDILFAKNIGAKGVVFGILTKNTEIDLDRCKELVSIAKPMECTFHRAFDCVKGNRNKALENLIEARFDRLLTAGFSERAYKGRLEIKNLMVMSYDKIKIIAGGGISQYNVRKILQDTGVKEIHASCSIKIREKELYEHGNLFEYGSKNTHTSTEKVKKIKEIINCYERTL